MFERMPKVWLIVLVALYLHLPAFGAAQTPLRDEASRAYEAAQQAEMSLSETVQSDRSRADYLRLIRLYERVYLITPHTGYADDALLSIASLYEDIDEVGHAITTLHFLIREYPGSRYVRDAELEIARLEGGTATPSELGTAATLLRAPARTGPVSVSNIRYWESSSSLRVVVDMDGRPTFTRGEVDNPPRVYVDLDDARIGAELQGKAFPVESVMLENIRVAQHDANTVRVVLDLTRLSEVSTFMLEGPDRLVIDVLGDTSRTRVTENVPVAPPPPPTPGLGATAAEPVEASIIAAEEPVGTPAQPNGNGDHSLVRSLGLKVGRVVIDPGHGGRDTGTIGPSGLTEKELVLDIAHRLKEEIEARLGAEVILTRGDDSFVPLETRTAVANQSEADLFLSIHANASRAESIRGFETYFLNLTTSREAMEIAARENAASQASISELQDIVRQIMLRDKLDESKEFANHIQQALASKKQLGRDRGVKQAPFVVLIGANMPSILAEISFITNPEDEQLLRGEARRQAIAEALFEGVRSYSETLSGFRTAQVQR